jgi:hypothetical protein
MLASFPASMLNQKRPDLGILYRFNLDPSRSSPHFSQGQLICDGYWWIGAKATRTVAPKALAAIWFCVSPLGLVGEAADWVRRGVALSR